MEQITVLYVEGPIGCGKSTVIDKITNLLQNLPEFSENYELVAVPEPVAIWSQPIFLSEDALTHYRNKNLGALPNDCNGSAADNDAPVSFLDRMYGDYQKNAYAFQIQALSSYFELFYNELVKTPTRKKKGDGFLKKIILIERSPESYRFVFTFNAFSEKCVTAVEMMAYDSLYSTVTRILIGAAPQKKIVIRIDVDSENCFNRMLSRGRPQELSLDVNYILSHHENYDRFFDVFPPTFIYDNKNDVIKENHLWISNFNKLQKFLRSVFVAPR